MRLIDEGLVTPQHGPGRKLSFSFQDVVLLRTAHALKAASVPTSRIVRSLERLRADLPPEVPLSGLRITAIGSRVAVRQREAHWEAETGQLLIDFDVQVQGDTVAVLDHARRVPPADAATARPARAPLDWHAHFQRGQDLEGTDDAGAMEAYRLAIGEGSDCADAYLNLGAMLLERGDAAAALALFTQALVKCGPSANCFYNQALAFEDLDRLPDALHSYEMALREDPEMADAHYNIGRLHGRLGRAQLEIRHLGEYRRLQRH